MGMDVFQFQMMQERCNAARGRKFVQADPIRADACDRESDLHDQIESYLRSKGWYYVHSRMDKKTTQQRGVPDFIVAMPGPVTIWAEVKRKGGKPSISQLGSIAHLNRDGHIVGIVESLEEFIALTRTDRA